MKQKLLTMAGVLAVLAVLGKYYAQPVLAQARAALVQDADNPARSPVRLSGQLSIDPGHAGTFESPLSAADDHSGTGTIIPVGKRLVLEYASNRCTAFSSPGIDVAEASITTNENIPNAVVFHRYELPFTRVNQVGVVGYYTSQPIRLYSDGTAAAFSAPLAFTVTLTGAVPAGGVVNCNIALSGYTVNLP